MSLVARETALNARRNDQSSALKSRRSQLRTLAAVTKCIAENSKISNLNDADTENSPSDDSEDFALLQANDLINGFYYKDSTIPVPIITRHNDSISVSEPNRPSELLPDQLTAPTDADAAVQATSSSPTTDPATSDDSMKLRSGVKPSSDLSEPDDDVSQSSATASKASLVNGQAAIPRDVASPGAGEEAQSSGATQQLLDAQHPSQTAKVVHISEEPRHDAERAAIHDRAHSSKSSVGQLQTHTEPASSPSSTVGPYSAATPLPPQDSPDTSPDSESADRPEEALTPKDLQPSPAAQREKEEHDRHLEAQKEIARKQALGDVSDPNDQLLWEEREAAARAAEEQRARMSVSGPEAEARNPAEETTAEEVAEDMVVDKETEKIEEERTSVGRKDEIPNSSAEADDDDDNITVVPRNRIPLAIDTSQLQTSAITPPLETPSNAAPKRPESSQSRKRTASDAFTPSRIAREGLQPPSAVSPTTMRHPQDTAAPSVSFQTPKRTPSTFVNRQSQTPNNAQAVLDELAFLKGAAHDPDRDYLESLFRIQAHDSPNVRSNGLPDLVRSASKALSTQDYFTSAHERLDYRELRKIYQLQNANKWSLRQMEKAKEPPSPTTHHDHMMAEMKWMRKDFKAERKMKQSVCAWMAARCADWVAADAAGRKGMQVRVRPPRRHSVEENDEQVPELEQSGESAAEEDATPPTPRITAALPTRLIVPPELTDSVSDLRKNGTLEVALGSLPVTGWKTTITSRRAPMDPMSKFVKGTVFPTARKPKRKRSKFDYEDDEELLNPERSGKRLREDRELPPEDQDIALFHPDNKPIRDRLHANNTFRPPSEFVMPSTQFYEFRNGSQWVWEDDQKLRKLAKEYSFNWSLISDELTLPASFKSSAERRTPWECFERWVELEQLPSEMRKTMYFKTWFQRLEQSQQAAERRYQAQVAALQAANGQQAHIPTRRRTTPTRVEKRKNTRYLWLVDAMRKLARKKEAQAYKQAEAQRAAAQRKTQTADPNHPRAPTKTPQEFSKMRQDFDAKHAEQIRQHRQKLMEAQQKQLMAQRQQQQQQHQGTQGMQQRPGSSSNMPAQQGQMQASGQQQPNMNGQQGRPQPPIATRNGHLAVPQVNAQGIPQAQMRPNGHMQNPQEMQRIAHANAQARNAQYGGQQQQFAQMQPSPGNGGMSNQQQMQSNQALMAAMQQQGGQQGYQQGNNHQMSGSPSMPPPPTPQNSQKTLSSGHVPAIHAIQAKLRQSYPQATDEHISSMATEMLRTQSQQSTNSARQNAMNAAAGINGAALPQQNGNMQQAYAQNQAAFQNNQQMQNGAVAYTNGDGSNQQGGPHQQQRYAQAIRARQMQQMGMQQQSPGMTHANVNGSPSMASASPAPVSPSMQFTNPNLNGTPQMAAAQLNLAGMNQQRPPSRSATPQLQRLGSSGSVQGLQQGMPSPNQVNGLQGSPRNMQASMAR